MNNVKRYRFSDFILLTGLLLIGGFHEYISCLLSVVMSIYLLLRMKKQPGLIIRKDFFTSAIVAVCLGYGLTCLWGIDRGMAFVGFLKYLPLFLYVLCLQQEKDAGIVETVLPYFAAAMAAVWSCWCSPRFLRAMR